MRGTPALPDRLVSEALRRGPATADPLVLEALRHGPARADPLVMEACRRVSAATGGRPLSVSALAAALGVSERQLLRRFRAAVGYGPKTLARVLRFRAFLDAAWAQPAPPVDLARLAAEAGYADQSHLTRDCRAFAGTTPSQLLAA